MDYMETREQEIDMKKMFYKMCKHWRRIVGFATIIAVLLCGFTALKGVIDFNDEEKHAKMKAEYDAIWSAYQEEGRQIILAKRDLEKTIEEHNEYMEESVLMDINHQDEWWGDVSYYVDTDYQIMPDSIYQNENPASKICQSYRSYYAGGDFHRYLLDNLSYDIPIKYLREIVSVDVDVSGRTISIRVRHMDKTHVDEILALFNKSIQSAKTDIDQAVYEHELITMSDTAYSEINLGLRDMQEQKNILSEQYADQMSVLDGNLLEWEKEEKKLELPVITVGGVIIQAVKMLIIGGLVAAVVAAGYYAAQYALSGKVQGSEHISSEVYLIGKVPGKTQKKHFYFIDKLVDRMFGITMRESEADDRIAIIGNNIGVVAAGKKAESVAMVSDISMRSLQRLTEQASKSCAIKMVSAGNILKDPFADKAVDAADSVVIVVGQGESRKDTLTSLIASCNVKNKMILGYILTNADSLAE